VRTIIFLCFVSVGAFWAVEAGQSFDVHDSPLINAKIDWKENSISLRADWKLNAQNSLESRSIIRSRLRTSLLSKLSEIIESLYARTDIEKRLPNLSSFWASLKLDTFQIAQNSASATLEIPLRGSHSLLSYFPFEPKQESWEAKNETINNTYENQSGDSLYDSFGSEALLYTGLVVDARNLPFVPSLHTQIFTSSGRLIYGPKFLTRTTYIKRGAVGFFTDSRQGEARQRAGNRPLIVPALDLARISQDSVVISDEDAAKILAHEGSVQNLRRARVIILLNADKLREVR